MSGELPLDGEDPVDSTEASARTFDKSLSETDCCLAGTNTGAFASSFEVTVGAGEFGKGVDMSRGLLLVVGDWSSLRFLRDAFGSSRSSHTIDETIKITIVNLMSIAVPLSSSSPSEQWIRSCV